MKYLVIAFCLSIFFSCKKKSENNILLKQETGQALGTTYSILYYEKQNNTAIKQSLDSIFSAVNNSMSTYISTSDISKINKGDTTVVVDAMFKEVFKTSEVIYKNTNGYFDPTVGSLVNAWGFGPQKLKLKMNTETVDSLMQYVGFNKLKLKSGSIKKETPNVYIDFNAIAKGYCIDRIGAYLDNRHVDNYLIEVGGELLSKGEHLQKQKTWTVGIDNPTQNEERTLYATLPLKDRAMATSGNYRKYRLDSISGKKYVHIIDAKTGFTKPSKILSVSVLAPSCAVADGYATAFMAMPLEKTKQVLKEDNNLDAYVIYSAPDGELKTYETVGFKIN